MAAYAEPVAKPPVSDKQAPIGPTQPRRGSQTATASSMYALPLDITWAVECMQ